MTAFASNATQRIEMLRACDIVRHPSEQAFVEGMFADLLHYARLHGVDVMAAIRMAERHVDAERTEDLRP